MELIVYGSPDHGVEALTYEVVTNTASTDIGCPLFDFEDDTLEFFLHFAVWSVVEA